MKPFLRSTSRKLSLHGTVTPLHEPKFVSSSKGNRVAVATCDDSIEIYEVSKTGQLHLLAVLGPFSSVDNVEWSDCQGFLVVKDLYFADYTNMCNNVYIYTVDGKKQVCQIKTSRLLSIIDSVFLGDRLLCTTFNNVTEELQLSLLNIDTSRHTVKVDTLIADSVVNFNSVTLDLSSVFVSQAVETNAKIRVYLGARTLSEPQQNPQCLYCLTFDSHELTLLKMERVFCNWPLLALKANDRDVYALFAIPPRSTSAFAFSENLRDLDPKEFNFASRNYTFHRINDTCLSSDKRYQIRHLQHHFFDLNRTIDVRALCQFFSRNVCLTNDIFLCMAHPTYASFTKGPNNPVKSMTVISMHSLHHDIHKKFLLPCTSNTTSYIEGQFLVCDKTHVCVYGHGDKPNQTPSKRFTVLFNDAENSV